MEDVIHPPEVPDGDHDGLGHLHSTGFCLSFPEIYFNIYSFLCVCIGYLEILGYQILFVFHIEKFCMTEYYLYSAFVNVWQLNIICISYFEILGD